MMIKIGLRISLGMLLSLCYWGVSIAANEQDSVAKVAPQLTILDRYVVPNSIINGLEINELSDLAWDEDEQLLYAVSDKGRLYHFKLVLKNNQIQSVQAIYGATLLDQKGKPLDWRDAEGLTVTKSNNGKRGDSQMVIALEGVPRLGIFAANGRLQHLLPLNPALVDRHKYRHSNTSLESVTWHPRYQFLTAPEQSLKAEPEKTHIIYSRQWQWRFPAYPAANSSITALQTLPNGNLLVLERAWSGILHPMVISLRYLDFNQCSPKRVCEVQNLYSSSSLLIVDNFEGLTHIKDNLYLMVSDDGGHKMQRTLLVLFKLEGVS